MNVTADDSSFDIDFGKRLARARSQRSVSLRDLALALGARGISLDSAALSRIENGKRAPKLQETIAISECLGVPLEQLLPEVGETHEASARYQLERALEDAAAKLTALAGRLDYVMLVHGHDAAWADRVIEHATDVFENPHHRIDSRSEARAHLIAHVLRSVAGMAVRPPDDGDPKQPLEAFLPELLSTEAVPADGEHQTET